MVGGRGHVSDFIRKDKRCITPSVQVSAWTVPTRLSALVQRVLLPKMDLFTFNVAAHVVLLLKFVECGLLVDPNIQSEDRLFLKEAKLRDSETEPIKVIRKRQFNADGFNGNFFDDKPRRDFPNNFNENSRPMFLDNIDDSRRPSIPNGFDDNRRPGIPNGFNDNRRPAISESFDDNRPGSQNNFNGFPQPGSRPNQNRPTSGNNFGNNDQFSWGTETTSRPRPSPVTEDRFTRQTTTTTPRNTSPGQQSPARPVENDCTRRCFTATAVYNPVCGSDNITYQNPTRLECARNCGIRVTISYYSACRPAPNRVFPNRD